MSVYLDGNFWSTHFHLVFVPQITYFCNAILQRVIPTFENIGEEADAVEREEYERLGRLPVGDDTNWDMVDAAEHAFDAGLMYYEAITAVRQTMINFAVAALYHMFEQQLLLFHRRQLLHPNEENDLNKIKISELKNRLRNVGIEIELLQSWPKVEELKLIANVVKHAEGRSAEELWNIRQDLFIDPSLDENWSQLITTRHVYSPLAGEDIYLSTDDLMSYQLTLVSFWKEFGEVIKENSGAYLS